MPETAYQHSEEYPPYLQLDLGGRFGDGFRAIWLTYIGTFSLLLATAPITGWIPVKRYPASLEVVGAACLVAFGGLCVWVAACLVWRLAWQAPDAIISQDGIQLHPSISSRMLCWSEISKSSAKWIRAGGRFPGFWVLELGLVQPIWSFQKLRKTKKLVLTSRNGKLIKEGAAIVRHYRLAAGWKR